MYCRVVHLYCIINTLGVLNIDTPCIYTIIIYVTALVLLQLAAKLFQKREQDS